MEKNFFNYTLFHQQNQITNHLICIAKRRPEIRRRFVLALKADLLGELVEIALAVIRMEQVLCLLGSGLAKVILVKSLDFGV